jgi:hypothetical protein
VPAGQCRDRLGLQAAVDDQGGGNISATSFSKIDAAHCCNLGLVANQWGALTSAAEGLADDNAVDMIENAEIFTANTVWLPQRVNIGPDRIIDQLHYKLAKDTFGGGKPVFSLQRIQNYAVEATKVIQSYQGTLQGKAGLYECCKYYLLAYSNHALEEVTPVIAGNIKYECDARKMNASDYLA